MKKAVLTVLCMLLVAGTVGCGEKAAELPETLSNDYVSVTGYTGIEIVPVVQEETTDEDVDQTVDYVKRNYCRNNDLDTDTELTDEMVQEISNTAETVEEYREEIRQMIDETKASSAKSSEEDEIWGTVMDNATVYEYPQDRIDAITDNLIEMYEGYANWDGVSLEEYLENTGVTDEYIQEEAEASLKQEMVAQLIAEQFDLEPTEEEYEQGMEDYVDKYNLTNTEVLLTLVPEEDMRVLILENKVKDWLWEQCVYVEPTEEESAEESTEEEPGEGGEEEPSDGE